MAVTVAVTMAVTMGMNIARGQCKVQTPRCASEESSLPGGANGAALDRAFTRAVIGSVSRRCRR